MGKFPKERAILKSQVISQLQTLIIPHRQIFEMNVFFSGCTRDSVERVLGQLQMSIFLPGQPVLMEDSPRLLQMENKEK